MPTDNSRTLIDRLGKVSDETLRQLRESGGAASLAGSGVALKFRAGDRVLDLATGTRGAVVSAEPRAGSRTGLYTVDLANGLRVARYENELAPDQAVAPAPER